MFRANARDAHYNNWISIISTFLWNEKKNRFISSFKVVGVMICDPFRYFIQILWWYDIHNPTNTRLYRLRELYFMRQNCFFPTSNLESGFFCFCSSNWNDLPSLICNCSNFGIRFSLIAFAVASAMKSQTQPIWNCSMHIGNMLLLLLLIGQIMSYCSCFSIQFIHLEIKLWIMQPLKLLFCANWQLLPRSICCYCLK